VVYLEGKLDIVPAAWIAGDGYGSEEITRLFEASGRKAVLIHAGPDRTAYAQIAAAAASMGAPALLVNNFFTPLAGARLHEYETAALDKAYRQLDAFSYFTKRAIPHFQSGGVIINIVPALGLIPARGQSLVSALSSGVIAMTRSWALELAPLGFRCCAIAFGFTEESDAPFSYPAIKRAVRPNDIYELIVSIEGMEMIDGSCIPLEGGYIAGYARDF